MQNNKTSLEIFLSGFFDGRGCFNISKDGKGFKQFKVKVMDNSDNTLITIQKMLLKLGVDTKRDHFHAIWISNRESVKRFLRIIIPFLVFRKEEVKEFENELYEYELSFIKKKEENKIPKKVVI